jgi:fumarate reductase subunit D
MPEEQAQAPIQAVSASKDAVREQDKIMLVLSYLGILSLIPLLTVKDSEYVKWHAKNGLVYGIGGGICLMVVFYILVLIPIIGWLTGCALWVGFLVVDIMAMVKALGGERWRIPLISDISEKL